LQARQRGGRDQPRAALSRDIPGEFGNSRLMNRARGLRSLAPILTPALAILTYFGLPSAEAEAAPKNRGGGFDEGGYIMLTPGAFVLPFGGRFEDRRNDFFDLGPGYGWGFGGGYMFARGPAFKATVGGVFEHSLLVFDNHDFRNFGGHLIRVMPEVRIGAGNNKVWGYGLFGAGPAGALFVWNWDDDFFCDVFDRRECRDRDGAVGFNLQFGGGVQAMITKNFFLGGEVDFDLGYYFDDDNRWRGRDRRDFSIYQVSIEFMLGWYF
jgi:hypothetical protein